MYQWFWNNNGLPENSIKIFGKIAEKIGFTEIELKVNLFLSGVLLIGLFSYYLTHNIESESNDFDYSYQDSLFFAADSADKLLKYGLKSEKDVDSEKELLDFSKNKNSKEGSSSKKAFLGKVNLNKAGIAELAKLPGIGIKTAQKIIDLRNKKKGFQLLNEILEVRGIGPAKFNDIKEYIYIE